MKRALFAALLLFVATGLSHQVDAQALGDSRLRGLSLGAGIDRFIYEGSGTTALTYRRSDLRPGGLGPELRVSLFPEALIARELLFAPDFGAAYNFAIPRSTLLIKAGGSAIIGINRDIGFVPGAHVGAGIILRIDDRTGIRIDATRHFYYPESGAAAAIWSLGFALTSLTGT